MDINRSRARPQQPQKTMDGFFVRPSLAARRPAQQLQPIKGMNPSQTRINDFKRADGFHAAPRRSLQPAGLPVKSTAPAVGHHAIAQQFEEPATSNRGRRGAARVVKHSKFRTFRKWTFRFTALALIVVIVLGGLLFGKGYFKLKKVFSGTTSAAALQANVDPSLLKGEGDGRINVLLLGIGGPAHDGADLTDTMMIASIDPINNQAVLFSIPRDLWVKMPNNYIANYQKINAAYESGKYKYTGKLDGSNANKQAINAGFAAVDSTVERIMGVPIHYNALINFQAFRQAVDSVNGVDINVPEQLYDPTMAWENHYNPILAKAGPQTMHGVQALMYVRSRETSSDFARAQRQRAVLVALKDKVMNLGTLTNPVKLSNLLSSFGDNVQTDISISDMSRLASIAKKVPSTAIQSVGLADASNSFVTTGNINGLSVVQPKAGLEDYSAIQAFVRSKLKDGYIAQENANVTVLNGTVVPGMATEKANELKSYGYNIGTVDNAPNTDYATTQIIDFTGGAKKYTLNYLKNRYHVTTLTKALPTGIVQGKADIVIILGTDATTTTSN